MKKLFLTKEEQEISSDIIDILSVLIDERNWCKRALARDKEGNQLFNHEDPKAVKWDIYGTIYSLECNQVTIDFLRQRARLRGYSDLDRLNDLNEHFYLISFLKECLNSFGLSFKVKMIGINN